MPSLASSPDVLDRSGLSHEATGLAVFAFIGLLTAFIHGTVTISRLLACAKRIERGTTCIIYIIVAICMMVGR